MKLTTAAIAIAIIILLVGFGGGFWVGRAFAPKCPETIASTSVTTTVRDTIRRPVPKPQQPQSAGVVYAKLKIKPAKALKGIDVAENPTQSGTLKAEDSATVAVPITRKVYQTPDYRAVVSGFRPNLDSMEVYRDTRTITETITKVLPAKKKWLALTAGPQVGVDINGQVVPSVGVTLGIILISK